MRRMMKSATGAFLTFIVVMGLVSCSSSKKGKNTSGLFVIVQGGKYGFINKKGEIVIHPQFDYADNFSDDVAFIHIGPLGNRTSNFIDKTGRVVLKQEFDGLWDFSEGLALIKISDRYGYIDTTGKIVINPQFVQAGSFHDGLASARIEDDRQSPGVQRWGFIDKNGKFVIQPKYEFVDDFSEGIARVKGIGPVNIYLNKEGKQIGNRLFYDGRKFSEGFAAVRLENNIYAPWTYINDHGNNVTTFFFDEAYDFSDGAARVKMNGKYGYVDTDIRNIGFGRSADSQKPTLFIEAQFDDAGDFSEGLAAVKIGGKWGYIDKTGKVTIPPQLELLANLHLISTVAVGKSRGYG